MPRVVADPATLELPPESQQAVEHLMMSIERDREAFPEEWELMQEVRSRAT